MYLLLEFIPKFIKNPEFKVISRENYGKIDVFSQQLNQPIAMKWK